MIEIDNKAIQQYVYFPKNSNVEADSFDLVLNSQVTQLDYEFTGLTDESRTKNYYKFYLDASQLNDGEFNYSIKANGEVVATGIIKIGEVSDDVPDRYNYNPFNDAESDNEIVQYYPTGNYKYRFQNNKIVEITANGVYNIGPDSGYTALLNVELHADIIPNKQTKNIEIVENSTVQVTADEGYDALKEVNVEVNVPVQDYWNSGYTSGYTVGYGEGYESGNTDGFESGYTSGYTDGFNTGYTSGCTDGYQEGYGDGFTTGYTSGKTDGIAEQKGKLISSSFNTNGTYSREDGFSQVTVEVPINDYFNSGYTSGYTAGYSSGETDGYNTGYATGYTAGHESGVTDGVAEQKAKLVSTAVTTNGVYSKEDGFSQVTVEVPTQDYWNSGYTSGKTDGVAEQKAKLISTAITGNGTYIREDGFNSITVNVPSGASINNQTKNITVLNNGSSAITYDAGYTGLEKINLTVNVPQTGYTQQDLDNAYASGMTAQKAKMISTAITRNGTYQRNDGFETVTVSVPTIKYHNLQVVPISTVSSGLTNKMQATVTQLGSATTKTYTGGGYAMGFDLLPGAEYTVTYNNVPGYNTPSPQEVSGVTTWSGYTFLTPWYEVASGESYDSQYFTFEVVSGGTINKPLYADSQNFQYSLNGGAWETFTGGTFNEGDKIQLKGTNSSAGSMYGGFGGTALFNAYGNVMSLLLGDNFSGQTTIPYGSSLSCLFAKDGVVSINNLVFPATTLTDNCYSYMFSGCTTLTTIGNFTLPATALTQHCYEGMFIGCTSLTTAPALPATTLADSCYDKMFKGCGLTSAPALPATTLANGCYKEMFRNCYSLTTAPDLLAPTLVEDCYYFMFDTCMALNSVKCLATNISADYCTYIWLNNVGRDGTFIKKSGVNWERSSSGIPSGWTVQEV